MKSWKNTFVALFIFGGPYDACRILLGKRGTIDLEIIRQLVCRLANSELHDECHQRRYWVFYELLPDGRMRRGTHLSLIEHEEMIHCRGKRKAAKERRYGSRFHFKRDNNQTKVATRCETPPA